MDWNSKNIKIVSRKYQNNRWAAAGQNHKMTCASSEDSDQPGHPPSLIRVFAVHTKKHLVLGHPSAYSDDSGQTEPMPRLISLRRARRSFCWFCQAQVVNSGRAAEPHKTHTMIHNKITKWIVTMWAATWQNQQNRPVWSESSLCAQWVAKDPSFLHDADSGDSDQTGRMPRLIWVFAGRKLTLLVFLHVAAHVRKFVSLLEWCS